MTSSYPASETVVLTAQKAAQKASQPLGVSGNIRAFLSRASLLVENEPRVGDMVRAGQAGRRGVGMERVIVVLTLLGRICLADVEAPLPSAAKAHLDRGLTLYTNQQYQEAIEEFRAGFDIAPRREFLFAWAQ